MTPLEATCGVFAHYLQIVPVIQSGQEVLGHLAVEFAFLVETAGLAVDIRLVVQHRVVSTQVAHQDLWLLGLIFSFLGTFFGRHGVSFNLGLFLSFPSSRLYWERRSSLTWARLAHGLEKKIPSSILSKS